MDSSTSCSPGAGVSEAHRSSSATHTVGEVTPRSSGTFDESKTSPISLLPPEIITHIIRVALPPILDHSGRQIFQVLRSVSHEWRQLCFSDPRLWSSLFVNIRHRRPALRSLSNTRRGHYPRRLKCWFEHTGPDIPLTLCLHAISYSLSFAEEQAVIDLLDHFRHRWWLLKLDVPNNWVARTLEGPLRHVPQGQTRMGWALIREFDFSWSENEFLELMLHITRDGHQEPFPFLEWMPNLRRLVVRMKQVTRELALSSFSHPTLEELSVTLSTPTPQFSRLLRNFPKLQYLSVHVLGQPAKLPNASVVPLQPPTSLGSLTSLRIDVKVDSMGLLNDFHCPSINTLSIQVKPGTSQVNFNPFDFALRNIVDFVQKHASTLRSLEIPGSRALTDASMRTLFIGPSCVQIEHLKLDFWPFTSTIPVPQTVLPTLRTLSIGIFGGYQEKDTEYVARAHSLLSFIERRAQLAAATGAASRDGLEGNEINQVERVSIRKYRYMREFPDVKVSALRRKGVNVFLLLDR